MQPEDQPAFRFRPMRLADLPMLAAWLRVSEVARWFTSAGYAAELQEQLADDRIRQRIVLLEGHPIAYVQDYDIHAFDNHHLAFLPKGARGIDTFMARASDMGRGIGSGYLSALIAEMRREGVPAFGIDPHPDNVAALRAYGKVGFRPVRDCDTEWGLVRILTLVPGARDQGFFAST